MKEKGVLQQNLKPRIIIHGGAGHITRDNLPPKSHQAYRDALLHVLAESQNLLDAPDATALDVAVHAVALLEDDPLFNCGKGAVFTRAGTNELEASVMVSRGYRKRGVGCLLLKHVKNPIKLAREMLLRGEEEDGGGAGQHAQLSGEELERLAASWHLEMVDQDYFFTQRRWDEHRRGLKGRTHMSQAQTSHATPQVEGNDPTWDGHEYLPQGTVGAVVLDRSGTLCVATSTGGLTNKLPGRIGDTPTLGAGFWAEEWDDQITSNEQMVYERRVEAVNAISRGDLSGLLGSCLPSLSSSSITIDQCMLGQQQSLKRAVAMSGTGNGDSFLRVCAARTAAAMARFAPDTSLARAVHAVAGPGGELERSAGSRFGTTGEGDGGMIGIELWGSHGYIVQDHNCGGMFRAWIDDAGYPRYMVFKEEY